MKVQKVHWSAGVGVSVCGRGANVEHLSTNRSVVTCSDCMGDDEFKYGCVDRMRRLERKVDSILTQESAVTTWGKRIESRLESIEETL